MAFGITATIGAGLLTAGASIYASNAQADAAKNASKTQSDAAQAAIDQQKAQFDAIQKLLAPYQQVGTQALSGQADLAGLNGPEAQQRALQAIQSSPEFASMNQQAENAILQNASATGGLRGGNVQGALATNRQAVLNQLINNQYARLGGLAGSGQNAAANLGAFGQQSASNIGGYLGQQGAAVAGGQIAQGQQSQMLANALSGFGGTLAGIQWPSAPIAGGNQ